MFWALLVFSYLLGSVSFAILLSKLAGKADPRLLGSGNPGATNMMRTAGLHLAVLTLTGDLMKGILPVFIAKYLDFTQEQQAWVGVSAVIGHLYPIYFHFKGGKGVATAAGMLIALSPMMALIAMVAWGLTFFITRTSSLSAMISLLVISGLAAYLQQVILFPILTLCLLIIWRHRRNLRDLLHGSEHHF